MPDRALIVNGIRSKAKLARRLAGHHLTHDPEPDMPDVLQTVGISEVSLLIAPVRR
jgi:hypothetical protein